METYYHLQDLPKFEEIGEEAPELAEKFFDYYAAVFAEGELTEREKAKFTDILKTMRILSKLSSIFMRPVSTINGLLQLMI